MAIETSLEANIASPLPVVIQVLKAYAPREYELGDTLEMVAKRNGWLECVRFMEEKILHNTNRTKLPGAYSGIHTTKR